MTKPTTHAPARPSETRSAVEHLRTTRRSTKFDLHLHSTRSDGRFEPEEVIRRCAAGGLDVIALTDHDVPNAELWGRHLIGGQSIHVIAGAEVTGTHEGREYHLLVYFPGAVPEVFRMFCLAQTIERKHRYELAVSRIGLPNLQPPAETDPEVRSLTRLHLAHALVDAGHAKDVRDAFSRYLSGREKRVPVMTVPFVDTIRLARAFGAITSWAHPPIAAVRSHVATFAAAGLHGLEGLRPYVTAKERNFYRRMARTHGLLLTGGSDWHGWHGSDGSPGLYAVERQQLDLFVDALCAAA